MINLLLSILLGSLVFMGLWYPELVHYVVAIIAGVLSALGLFIFISRAIGKKVQAKFSSAQGAIQKQKVKLAVSIIESALPYAKWQPFLKGQIHAQIGQLLFMVDKHDEAMDHLKKTFGKIAMSYACMAVIHYKKKDKTAMYKSLDEGIKYNGKDAFIYALGSYLAFKLGNNDKAMAFANKGIKKAKDDRLNTIQKNLANKKVPTMKPFGEMWMAMKLDKKLLRQQMSPHHAPKHMQVSRKSIKGR